MSGRSEDSQIREEEPQEEQVALEEPIAAATTTAVAPPSDSEPEEADEGDEIGGFSYGPLSSEEDFYGQQMDQIQELEGRVQHLEAEDQVHQYMEEQYKSLVHQLVARNAELSEKLHEAEHKIVDLKNEKEALHVHWDEEVATRVRLSHQRDDAMDRIHDLENEVRGKSARMDKMSYAFKTAFGRWQSRVHHYPVEEGQSRRLVSRKRMIEMGEEEFESAKKRGMIYP